MCSSDLLKTRFLSCWILGLMEQKTAYLSPFKGTATSSGALKTDKLLAARGETALLGKTAIDGIRATYRRFRDIFSGPRWDDLAGPARGARVQRPL